MGGGSRSSSICGVLIFIKCEKIWSIFIQIILMHFVSLLSDWDSNYTYVSLLDTIPHVTVVHFILFKKVLFTLCFSLSDFIVLFSLLLILSSVGYNLLLKPLSEFLNFDIIFFLVLELFGSLSLFFFLAVWESLLKPPIPPLFTHVFPCKFFNTLITVI